MNPFARHRLQALGRLKVGEMNKTEKAYADYLRTLQMAGEVLWFRFEGIKLRLADNTFLTVDFAVLPVTGVLEMHDVKGAKGIVTDDSKVKMRVAADQYPLVFKRVYPKPKKEGGGWLVEEVG